MTIDEIVKLQTSPDQVVEYATAEEDYDMGWYEIPKPKTHLQQLLAQLKRK